MNVVITGASSGIGAAAARCFSKEGYRVILLARRKDRLEEIRKELGEKHIALELDVTCRIAVETTFSKIEKEIGPVDILLNNAGAAFGLEPAFQANLDDWEKCINTNINGLVYCTRAALSGMVQRNQGHIINLGSIAGTYPYPGGNVYGATKAFVHQFSLNLRADLIGTFVKVTCVEPGLVGSTEFSNVRFRGDEEMAKKPYQNTIPLSPEDIAETIVFCAKQPPHVNINTIEIMPISQASAHLTIHRQKT